MIKGFEEETRMALTKKYSTPHLKWLFKVNKKATKLKRDKAKIFLKYVMKITWVMKRTSNSLIPS